MKDRKKKRVHPVAAFCGTLGTVLLVLIVLAAAPAVLPRVFGVQVYEVISGSMEPAIPTGSLVYVTRADAEDVKKGEVIAYDSGGSLITHRVVENRKLMGEFVTKGDANEKKDPNPVSYDQLKGKVIFSIPVLGEIAGILSEMEGKMIAAAMIVLAVILHVAAAIAEKRN